MSIKSPFLKLGDTIAIVASARKISREEMQPAINIFTSWGLKVNINDDLFQSENQFAGSDEIRAKNLQQFLDDNSIRAIFCARGGYGTVRIIDKLNFDKFSKNPKWIVGYSDITVLHSHIHSKLKIETLHGTMPINMQLQNANEESILSVRNFLFGEKVSYEIPTHPLNKEGEAKAQLIGGNLSVLYSLLGSDSDIDTKGKILFLEDLDEYLYHIDRMMMNMQRNRKLAHLSGLIIGGMSDMKDNAIPYGKTAEKIIFDLVKAYNFPICFGFPAGHEQRNLALNLGAEITLKVTPHISKVLF